MFKAVATAMLVASIEASCDQENCNIPSGWTKSCGSSNGVTQCLNEDPCYVWDDCDSGFCDNGTCGSCKRDSDCPLGGQCQTSGKGKGACRPPSCETRDDCGATGLCYDTETDEYGKVCYYCGYGTDCSDAVDYTEGEYWACGGQANLDQGVCYWSQSSMEPLSGGAIFGIIAGGVMGLALCTGIGFGIGRKF